MSPGRCAALDRNCNYPPICATCLRNPSSSSPRSVCFFSRRMGKQECRGTHLFEARRYLSEDSRGNSPCRTGSTRGVSGRHPDAGFPRATLKNTAKTSLYPDCYPVVSQGKTPRMSGKVKSKSNPPSTVSMGLGRANFRHYILNMSIYSYMSARVTVRTDTTGRIVTGLAIMTGEENFPR
jgi:hypothetical protein